ncbi:hypothetical protein E2C01_073137 [Portunus trituberculatus]|uniref:Uncharacterized protein n=1 Tax=Portunus trituberculatus TaxID=210409 RepID=A0A5B7ID82_PORTR|nr:hypothetical protein [Portunus trituberculatus]
MRERKKCVTHTSPGLVSAQCLHPNTATAP